MSYNEAEAVLPLSVNRVSIYYRKYPYRTNLDLSLNSLTGKVKHIRGLLILILQYLSVCYTCFAGYLPYTMCDMTNLQSIYFTTGNSYPLLSCSPRCLSSVPNKALPELAVSTCPSERDNGLCSFIAAIDVYDISSSYTEWTCTTDGFTTTDPCVSFGWTGTYCDADDNIDGILLSSRGVSGTVLYGTAYLCSIICVIV